MAGGDDKAPIIIKKKKVTGGHGHHGGAWKVAYADFVTAMMAFFLLMWLLNATTEDQKKGLADYFNPSITVHRTSGGGSGPMGGDSVFAEETAAQQKTGASQQNPSAERQARGDSGTEQEEVDDPDVREVVIQRFTQLRGESAFGDALLNHVRLRRTDEGLVIEVSELPAAPLFNGAGAEPTTRMLALMAMVADVIGAVKNHVAVDAHLQSPQFEVPSEAGWDVTSARALVARDLLAEAGVGQKRFARVAGEADRAPSWPDPLDLRNRRIEVILLIKENEQN